MPTLEQHDPQVRRDGLKTDTAVSFGSTLTVAGVTTLASIIITSTLALTGALTGSTAVFSGQVTASSVSSSKWLTGIPTIVIGTTGTNSVSSVASQINGTLGASGAVTFSSTLESEGTASLYAATVQGSMAVGTTADIEGAQTNSSTIIATGAITSRGALAAGTTITAGTSFTGGAGGDLTLGGSTYGTASSVITGFSCQNWQSTTSADVYACAISNGAVVCALGACSN